MLKIYGHAQTRAFRTLWMAEELSLSYEHERLAPNQTRTAEFLKLNPNGRLPTIVDGDVVLFESMAINLYLACRYGGATGLWPGSIEDQGRAYQWSFWAMTEVEASVLELVLQRFVLAAQRRPGEGTVDARRDTAKEKTAEDTLKARFEVIEGALEDRPYLLGSAFTVADLNVGSVLALLLLPGVNPDMSGSPRVRDWLLRMGARPAVAQARKR